MFQTVVMLENNDSMAALLLRIKSVSLWLMVVGSVLMRFWKILFTWNTCYIECVFWRYIHWWCWCFSYVKVTCFLWLFFSNELQISSCSCVSISSGQICSEKKNNLNIGAFLGGGQIWLQSAPKTLKGIGEATDILRKTHVCIKLRTETIDLRLKQINKSPVW